MTSNFFDMTDKVILITGAGGHLGRAISKRLAAAGARVILGGRNQEPLKDLEHQIVDSGGDAKAVILDITDQENIKSLLDNIQDKYGRLDGLVNNAFRPLSGSIDAAKMEDFQKAFETNVSALFFLSQQCLPLLAREADEAMSSIVNISSMYGMVSPDPSIYGDSGMNNPPFYGASKAAVIQLSRYFAGHVTDRGIRTNTVSPGAFPPESVTSKNPDFHAEMCKKNPMKRVGQPEEVAAAVHFLLSEDATYINGVNLPVDGGWTAW